MQGLWSYGQEHPTQNERDFIKTLNLKSRAALQRSQIDSAWLFAYEAFGLASTSGFTDELAESRINMGNIYVRNADNDSAIFCFQEALIAFETAGNKLGIGKAYNSLGGVYCNMGEYDTASVLTRKALQIALNVNNQQGLADGYNNMGAIFFHQGEYPNSLSSYLMALQLSEALNNQYDMARTYSNIGNIYFKQSNFEQATIYFEKALKIQEELNDSFGMGRSYHNIGSVQFSSGDFNKALETYALALETKKSAGDVTSMARTYLNIGSVHYLMTGDTAYTMEQKDSLIEITRVNYKIAIANFELINDKQGVVMTNNNLGTILISLGDQKGSKYHLEQGLEAAKEIGSKPDIMMSYFALASCDSAFGNWESAYQNKNLYLQYRDSMVSESNTKQMMEAELNFEYERKEWAILEEQQRKDMLHTQDLMWQKRFIWILSGSFTLLVLSIFLYFRWRRQAQRSAYDRQLAEQKKQSANSIILAQEDERKRIARDLHDSLGQLLSTARINLELLSEEHKLHLVKPMAILEDAVVELHNISFNLMPGALEEGGLKGALEEMSGIIESMNDCRVQLKVNGLDDLVINRNMAYNIYRIVQESVNNALKHAEANQISLNVKCDSDKLHITIHDNGKGFDHENVAHKAGNGLRNIQQRSRWLDATFTLSSSSGNGTSIILEIPLN